MTVHMCQEDVVIIGWILEHARLGWTYLAHTWHWVLRHKRPVHQDGCCRKENHP